MRWLIAVVLVGLLFSCQGPASSTTTLTIGLPYHSAGRASAAPVELPSTAFPTNILSQLDHYVVRLLVGVSPAAPDQVVSTASPTATFVGVPPGNYTVVVQAWSLTAEVAEAQTLVTVAQGASTNVGSLVLVPLSNTGSGRFDGTLDVGTAVAALAASNSLAATLSQLNYTGGVLTGNPTLVTAPVALQLSVPSAQKLRLLAWNTSTNNPADLAAGNYLLHLTAQGAPLADYLVQIYPGSVVSSFPAGTSLSDVLLGSPAAAPAGLTLEQDASGGLSFSWALPNSPGRVAYYQVGFNADETASAPAGALTLAAPDTGLNPSFLTLASTRVVGSNLTLALDTTVAPWTGGDNFFRLYVRSVLGGAIPSSWISLFVDKTLLPVVRPIPSLRFWGLATGTRYDLELREGASLVQTFPFRTDANPDAVTWTFPGLLVRPSQSLVLVRHELDGTFVNIPLSLSPLSVPSAASLAAPLFVLLGFDGSTETGAVFEDPLPLDGLEPFAAWNSPTITHPSVWTLDWNPVYPRPTKSLYLFPNGWSLQGPSGTFQGTGNPVQLTGGLDPVAGAVSTYVLRPTFPLGTALLVGPATTLTVDLKAPEVTVTSPSVGANLDLKSGLIVSVSVRDSRATGASGNVSTLRIRIVDPITQVVYGDWNANVGDGSATSYTWSGAVDGGGTWGTFLGTVSNTPQERMLTVEVKDASLAGNTTTVGVPIWIWK